MRRRSRRTFRGAITRFFPASLDYAAELVVLTARFDECLIYHRRFQRLNRARGLDARSEQYLCVRNTAIAVTDALEAVKKLKGRGTFRAALARDQDMERAWEAAQKTLLQAEQNLRFVRHKVGAHIDRELLEKSLRNPRNRVVGDVVIGRKFLQCRFPISHLALFLILANAKPAPSPSKKGRRTTASRGTGNLGVYVGDTVTALGAMFRLVDIALTTLPHTASWTKLEITDRP